MRTRNRRLTPRLTRGVVLIAAVTLTVAAGAGTVLADPGGVLAGSDNAWPYNTSASAPGSSDPVLAAVGDISCQPGSPQGKEKATDVCTGGVLATTRNAAQNSTAMYIENIIQPTLVAVLGDEQYQNGYYSDFEGSFDKYWGAFKMLQRPAPGNHEFYDNHGQLGVRGLGYFDYYNGFTHNIADGSEVDTTLANGVVQPTPLQNGQAGPFGQTGNGWYSYDLGSWHLISLNAECADEPGGCSPNGAWVTSETTWLANDLSQDHSPCTLAYWHQPTFSSTVSPTTSDSAEGQMADAWWQLLYQHHATLILNGHDHVYSRFAPMNPQGQADPANGIREFIVGTGGESLDTIIPGTPNLLAWADQYYGVLKLTLKPSGYDWDYESSMISPAAPSGTPQTYSDTGSASCNNNSGNNGQGNDNGNGNGNS